MPSLLGALSDAKTKRLWSADESSALREGLGDESSPLHDGRADTLVRWAAKRSRGAADGGEDTPAPWGVE